MNKCKSGGGGVNHPKKPFNRNPQAFVLTARSPPLTTKRHYLGINPETILVKVKEGGLNNVRII
ncbi:hypothetical protein Btus_0234 [Kyrpidia tusciae DSM 2912]|uniref:Uncharacterized protein n=1 Tax=Kyrpidia tusciae (strain DSM 2912 / NBRC 15312 / T2) TaxID=562970 RepID=D5WSC6_KYRT2|nr:hypothetical protein Btus_0234 [Kyrpidia tusciae DSM 2912]